MTSCDLINNRQRGFSVETSKLEAVLLPTWFLGKTTSASQVPGLGCTCPLPTTPSWCLEKGPQMFFYRFFHPTRENRSHPEGALPRREAVSVQRDGLGSYNLHLAHEGQVAERTSSAPKKARLAGPSQTGQE